jgi:hypothetical protein
MAWAQRVHGQRGQGLAGPRRFITLLSNTSKTVNRVGCQEEIKVVLSESKRLEVIDSLAFPNTYGFGKVVETIGKSKGELDHLDFGPAQEEFSKKISITD